MLLDGVTNLKAQKWLPKKAATMCRQNCQNYRLTVVLVTYHPGSSLVMMVVMMVLVCCRLLAALNHLRFCTSLNSASQSISINHKNVARLRAINMNWSTKYVGYCQVEIANIVGDIVILNCCIWDMSLATITGRLLCEATRFMFC